MLDLMLLGLPDSTLLIVGGAVGLIVLLLLLWGIKFREGA